MYVSQNPQLFMLYLRSCFILEHTPLIKVVRKKGLKTKVRLHFELSTCLKRSDLHVMSFHFNGNVHYTCCPQMNGEANIKLCIAFVSSAKFLVLLMFK